MPALLSDPCPVVVTVPGRVLAVNLARLTAEGRGAADTPFIKAPYSARVKSTLPVLMSALRVSPAVVDGEEGMHDGKHVGQDAVEYVYEQVSLHARVTRPAC